MQDVSCEGGGVGYGLGCLTSFFFDSSLPLSNMDYL